MGSRCETERSRRSIVEDLLVIERTGVDSSLHVQHCFESSRPKSSTLKCRRFGAAGSSVQIFSAALKWADVLRAGPLGTLALVE